MNHFKTTILLALLTAVLVLGGYKLGGQSGAIIALILAGAMNFLSYWYSDKIVLAMYRARPVSRQDSPEIYGIVERLTVRAGLPMPRIYEIPTGMPNAFATGRDPAHAAVAVTSGIVNILTDDELEAVIAHELAHVRNRDTLVQTIAATLAGAITLLATIARWGLLFAGLGGRGRDRGGLGLLLMAILAPVAAVLIQLAISRSREYLADQGGAMISGRPLSLARALEKLDAWARNRPVAADPTTAHLFIVNPLRVGLFATLFSTHPPTSARVARLRRMGGVQE